MVDVNNKEILVGSVITLSCRKRAVYAVVAIEGKVFYIQRCLHSAGFPLVPSAGYKLAFSKVSEMNVQVCGKCADVSKATYNQNHGSED